MYWLRCQLNAVDEFGHQVQANKEKLIMLKTVCDSLAYACGTYVDNPNWRSRNLTKVRRLCRTGQALLQAQHSHMCTVDGAVLSIRIQTKYPNCGAIPCPRVLGTRVGT